MPAPGDPWYANYTKDPLNMPLTPAPTAVATMPPLVDPPADQDPMPAGATAPGPTPLPDQPSIPAPMPSPPIEGGQLVLTRLIRTQLVIFSVASIIGMAVMIVVYLQAPTLLGVGRMTVTLQLPATGGLYQFSNVTYRASRSARSPRCGPPAMAQRPPCRCRPHRRSLLTCTLPY